MKINFNAGYKQVSSLLYTKEAVTVDPSIRASFGRVSSKGQDFNSELTENIEKAKLGGKPEASPESIQNSVKQEIASYDIDPPTTLVPQPERHSVPINNDIEVNQQSQGVKPPTLLEARRVSATGSYSPVSAIVPAESRSENFVSIIQEAGGRHGIDPALGMAVARAESSFNPVAISSDGYNSKGLFQLLDSTGKDMMARLAVNKDYDPYDPSLNSDLGIGYLRYLHDIFSKETVLPNQLKTLPAANSSSLEKLAVAAFNAGEGRVAGAQRMAEQAGKDPSQYESIENYLPEITQKYVARVSRFREQYFDQFEPEL